MDGEEQQVESQRQEGGQVGAAQLQPAAGCAREQSAEDAGDEEVAIAHHGRSEDGGLQPRQAGRRVSRVEGVVGALELV